ncbi:cupin [Ilumatobacter sp.]|uniref:cupin n=1 Tax=Ilumatobacter sp. TaxID=1967498 RepID=UPI003C4C1485
MQTVVDCTDLDGELRFFVDRAGFRVHLVSPADDPRRVVVERNGSLIELRRGSEDHPVRVRIDGEPQDDEIVSPGGSIIELTSGSDAVDIPPNRPTLTVIEAVNGDFGTGRAGMQYRDLLPDRWGGRFIASHIRIDEEGDVADWVHFHRIRFQMIFVAAGWVDVVYEGQGEPFRMYPGDCVLQPPEIRHRVLRSSGGLEVIEIGCPAEHDTLADHELDLPTTRDEPDRSFSGQRFVRHVAEGSQPTSWIDPSLDVVDTGIGEATDGLAGAVVVSSASGPVGRPLSHDGEFALVVGLAGDAVLDLGERTVALAARTSVAIPPGTAWSWSEHGAGHRALVVTLPADGIRGC